MATSIEIPRFAQEDWYSDPRDHRCPHDAWLDALEIRELAEGERKQKRHCVVVVRLLSAFHDGEIVFRYSDVKNFSLAGYSERGMGDWLDDSFSVTTNGLLRHEITWCLGADLKSDWFIEATEISYEWFPKTG